MKKSTLFTKSSTVLHVIGHVMTLLVCVVILANCTNDEGEDPIEILTPQDQEQNETGHDKQVLKR